MILLEDQTDASKSRFCRIALMPKLRRFLSVQPMAWLATLLRKDAGRALMRLTRGSTRVSSPSDSPAKLTVSPRLFACQESAWTATVLCFAKRYGISKPKHERVNADAHSSLMCARASCAALPVTYPGSTVRGGGRGSRYWRPCVY